MKDPLTLDLITLHSNLYAKFGDPLWWPGETPFEVAVGAVLTQNTSWTNVERAISDMKREKVLFPQRMDELSKEKLEDLIRPAGFYHQKATYLKGLTDFFLDRFEGDVEGLKDLPLMTAREELLALKGIGKETADSILCYGAGMPILVIDSYTRRVLGRYLQGRHIDLAVEKDHDRIQVRLMNALRGDAHFYNRFHALIVILAKDLCKVDPRCRSCPLQLYCGSGKESSMHRTK